MNKECIKVGVKLRCIIDGRAYSRLKKLYGQIATVYELRQSPFDYGLWPVRFSRCIVKWDKTEFNMYDVWDNAYKYFELVDCPENEVLLPKELDQQRRQAHADKYM